MRTMLISLILFCSLTQFAIAEDDPAPVLAKNDLLLDCGDGTPKGEGIAIYQCYVPEACAIAEKAVTDVAVTKVYAKTPIFNDCPAFIRFHQYNDKRIYVSIESFRTAVKHIQFELKDHNDKRKHIFECKIETQGTGKEERIIRKGKYGDGKSKQLKLKSEEDEKTDKLKCTFEVKTKLSTKFFDSKFSDRIHFEIDNEKTKILEDEMRDFAKCDPSVIEFTKTVGDKSKLYETVKYRPGHYYCDKGDKYKMEFREGNGGWKPASIICKGDKFLINSIETSGTIDARCTADAKSFCDYDVKVKGDNGPHRRPPDATTNTLSSMECKEPYKYLNVVESAIRTKTLLKPTFECLYYGGNAPVWVVSDINYTKTLTKKGPEVYCSDTVECHQVFKVSENQVENGFLDANFLPACGPRGTLSVKKGGTVMNTTCDKTTGNSKYIDADGAHHVIKRETRFLCTYPKDVDKAKDAENAQKIAYTTIAVGGGLVAFICLLVAGFCAFTFHRLKKERKKLETMNRAAWIKYCATDDERKEYNAQNNIIRDSEDSEPEPEPYWNWNNMIMFLQQTVMNAIGKDATSGQIAKETLKTCIELPPLAKAGKDKKVDKDTKKNFEYDYEPDPDGDDVHTDKCLLKNYSWYTIGIKAVKKEREQMQEEANEASKKLAEEAKAKKLAEKKTQ